MPNSIDITRKIYDETMNWYRSAETKAQILLGVLATFTGVLTALILGKPAEIAAIMDRMDIAAIISLILAFVALLFGIFACYYCLYSRVRPREFIKQQDAGIYPDERLFFFGYHAFHDPEKLSDSLKNIRDDADEVNVYSSQIIHLSRNVLKKHVWVNRAFFSIAVSLVLLWMTTVLYLTNLKPALS